MLIRKISIGPDLLKAMNYSIGQPMLRGAYKVSTILANEDGHIQIWLENEEKEVMLWKTVNRHTPFTLEYNMEY